MIKGKVRKLWETCFNDSREFIDMYFQLRYKNEINITIQSGEETIAALQMLPYPMTFEKEELSTAYISGACTHPDFRNRGVMHELLLQTFAQMHQNGVALSTLIPAEPWLFDYYARNGFATVFKNQRRLFSASDLSSLKEENTLKATCEYQQEVYDYLNRKLRERSFCIQHTPEDFKVILADLKLGKGCIYTLTPKGNIAALAVAYPLGNGQWSIGEMVSDSPETEYQLLQQICKTNGVSSLQVLSVPDEEEGQPLGMGRIINAKLVLQHYAAIHPEKDLNIQLTDEQLSINNGYYYLNNGQCMVSTERLPGSHLTLTIAELTQKIFEPLNPVMSLMLN